MDNYPDFTGAKRARKVRMGFYIHLAAYVAVNALLITINFTLSPARLWFYWPLVGWGIGLFAHALATFVLPKLLGSRRNRS